MAGHRKLKRIVSYFIKVAPISLTGVEYSDAAQLPSPLECGLCTRLESLTVRNMHFRHQNTDDLPLLICKLIDMDHSSETRKADWSIPTYTARSSA